MRKSQKCMRTKIFIGIGALMAIAAITAFVLLFHVFEMKERAISVLGEREYLDWLWKTKLLDMLFALAIGVVAFLYGGYLAIEWAVRDPIRRMTRTAKRISEGELDLRFEEKGAGEAGELLFAFNSMTERLAAYPARLEKDVWGRTKKLNEANENLKKLLEESKRAEQIVREQAAEIHETSKILIRRDYELMEANRKLEELDKIKSEFISVAAHQMRTPLTAVRWTLQALYDGEAGELSGSEKETVRDGLASILSAINIVNNLLDVARMEGGRFELSLATHPISPIISRVALSLKAAHEMKGISFHVAVPDDLPAIECDEEKISIVFENLLQNAIKYTPPGGTVTVSGKKKDRSVEITVTDTGIGIPEDDMPRVFTKFFRSRNAILLETSGTGLGLYMVKKIIEKHGGRVSVESKEEAGSTFTIMLPIAQA